MKIANASGDSGECVLVHGSEKSPLLFSTNYQIPFDDLSAADYWDYSNYPYQHIVRDGFLSIIPDASFSNCAYTSSIGAGAAAGSYSAIICTAPDTIQKIMAQLEQTTWALEAQIVSGSESYVVDHITTGTLGIYLKSAKPWDKEVHWIAYDTSSGKIVTSYAQIMPTDSDTTVTSNLPLVWAAKYSISQNNTALGALYGFVDSRMSLLALATDTVSKVIAAAYEDSGVPALAANEIIIDSANLPMAPKNYIIIDADLSGNNATRTAADETRIDMKDISVRLTSSGMLELTLGNFDGSNVSIKMYDLRGRVIQSWDAVRVCKGLATLSLQQQARGAFVMRIVAAGKAYTTKLLLK